MLEPEEIRRWGRQIESLANKVGHDDPEALRQMACLAEAMTTATKLAANMLVAEYRDGPGDRSFRYSWGEIGAALGISRQAAWERLSGRV